MFDLAEYEFNWIEVRAIRRQVDQLRLTTFNRTRTRARLWLEKLPITIRPFVNYFLTWLSNVLYDAGITDEATCYKAFRTDLLKSLPLRCKRFELCPEVTALIRKRGIGIHDVPIAYRARSRAEGKKIRWYDAFEAVRTLIKCRFITLEQADQEAGGRFVLLDHCGGKANGGNDHA